MARGFTYAMVCTSCWLLRNEEVSKPAVTSPPQVSISTMIVLAPAALASLKRLKNEWQLNSSIWPERPTTAAGVAGCVDGDEVDAISGVARAAIEPATTRKIATVKTILLRITLL